jgi:glycosyltransferase involved in cell wall biosynthesis
MKPKVLIPIYDWNASEYFRSGLPVLYLTEHHAEDVYVEAGRNIQVWDINTLKNFDVIHFHRHFGYYESAPELFPMLQQHGVKLVLDMDDFWEVPADYSFAEALEVHKDMVNIIPLVDYVVVTTDILADKVREYNQNVIVIPNAIDDSDPLWKVKDDSEGVVRVGWAGSRRRYQDLIVLKEAVDRIYADKELEGKFKFVLCGGDEEEIEIFKGPNFKHVPGTNAKDYPALYDELDVCLAPLSENEFNECRSELKFIEAGIKKKGFIGQDFGVYHKHISHSVNGFLAKTSDDWYEYMRFFILNPKEIKRMGEELYSSVHPWYTMKVQAEKRIKFYKNICKDETK